MDIQISHLLEGARNARGLTVIIDVFRAFTTACYVVSKGAGPVYPVGSVADAFEMKNKLRNALLVGELDERPPAGFDYGNSPWLLMEADIGNRPVIHRTSSGTQGIVNAVNADEIITGSFVNAGAIEQYIRIKKPSVVSLVCMGYACEYPTDEDTLCAEYLRNRLTGKENDWNTMKEQIRKGSGARFFEEKSQTWAPREDFELCLELNRFDFVLKVIKHDGVLTLKRIDVRS